MGTVVPFARGLTADQLTPCAGCNRPLSRTEHPLFSRFLVKLAGLDHRAAVLGDRFACQAPAAILASYPEVNVCHSCMETMTVQDLCEKLGAEA